MTTEIFGIICFCLLFLCPICMWMNVIIFKMHLFMRHTNSPDHPLVHSRNICSDYAGTSWPSNQEFNWDFHMDARVCISRSWNLSPRSFEHSIAGILFGCLNDCPNGGFCLFVCLIGFFFPHKRSWNMKAVYGYKKLQNVHKKKFISWGQI